MGDAVRVLTAISTGGLSEVSRASGGPVVEEELGIVSGESPKGPEIPGIEEIEDKSSAAEQAVNRRRRGAIGLIERRSGLKGGLLVNKGKGNNNSLLN